MLLCGGARRRQAHPLVGLHIVARHSLSVVIPEAKIVLGECVALFGGFSVPADSLGEILLHAVAVVVHETEAALCCGVILGGGFAVPAESFAVVPLRSLAGHPKVVPRDSLAANITRTEAIVSRGAGLL